MRLGFFLAIVFAHVALARTQLPIALEHGAQASVKVSSCFNNLPPCGYAPVEVTINNWSGDTQGWTFQFSSPAFAYRDNIVRFATKLEVQNNAARTFKLLVPLTVLGDNSYYSPLSVTVTGYGIDGATSTQFPTGNRSGNALTAFVAISEKLSGRSWSALESELTRIKHQLNGTSFAASDLPEEWRAFSGINAIWITDNEFAAISTAQRGALHDWIARGGVLTVCGSQEIAADFHASGFGRINAVPSRDLDVKTTASTILALRPSLESQLTTGYTSGWRARDIVGEIKANVPLLIGFMGVFAAIAGPVNLFVFAGHGRRHRLFWTTPIISISASALLFVLIVFQDGFGGTGARIALVQILPDEKKAVVLQEQISRTGMLRGSSFQTRDDALIAPISLENRTDIRRRTFDNSGTFYAGDWFTSRSLQAQWIETIIPTRAEIALLNASEVRDHGVAPLVVSSIAGTLSELYLIDEVGRRWRATNIRTGEKATLQPTTKPPEAPLLEAGTRVRDMWARAKDQHGYFYATSSDTGVFVDTLSSIRWNTQHVIYLGPISLATP